MDADTWRLARERKLDSFDSDIAAAIQEKQAKLQEAGLHQNAYHEEARATQPRSMPDMPIGQIVGNDGRPMQVTKADIATLVQLERDDQAHKDRALEARKHYPDWEQQARSAAAAGVDGTNQQAAFIKTLPNSADVVYYLTTHHDETRALARMSSHEATRALINISHKVARPAEAAPRKTTAPKPPSPVGGTSRGNFDVNDESVTADEWMRRRNADLRKRGNAADQVGRAADYYKGLGDYASASKYQGWVDAAKDALAKEGIKYAAGAAGAGIGGTAAYKLWQWMTGK